MRLFLVIVTCSVSLAWPVVAHDHHDHDKHTHDKHDHEMHDHDHHGHHHHHDDDAHRQHGVHVHGHGALGVALEGPTLEIVLEAPAANFLGFEHAPRTDDEKKAVAEANAKLSAPDRLFVPDQDADCSVEAQSIDMSGLEPEAEHSDITVQYRFICAQSGALTALTLDLFEAFPGFEEIEAVILSDKGQSAATLTPQSHRLSLQ